MMGRCNQSIVAKENAVIDFIRKHAAKILGTLSCFDRIIFHGHLPLARAEVMNAFLDRRGMLRKEFKGFVTKQAERLKAHAKTMAERAGRPYRHLCGNEDKEDEVQKILKKDAVERGLICVFSAVERDRTFKLCYGEGRPYLMAKWRPCLCLYFYFLDPELGLIHIRLQTWFPFHIQIALNGHDWLARKLARHHIAYRKIDNAFVSLEDFPRAQRLADRFVTQNWPRLLDRLAHRVNPLLRDLVLGYTYYWVTNQAEFATDIVFANRATLQDLYKKLLRHSTLCFSAEDVMAFLGRKLYGTFAGELITDCKRREPGARVKHRMKANWLKMYDKFGCVLRVETVINHPYEFKVRRSGTRYGKRVIDWFPMNKGVANLYRYAQVSLRANSRYLQALSVVDDPTQAYGILREITRPKRDNGRWVRGFNPLHPDDVRLFAVLMRGEHHIMGFRNGHLVRHLYPNIRDPEQLRRISARISRLLKRLRTFRLIAKIHSSRRYRVTERGLRLLSASIHLYEEYMPQLLAA